jgi:ADP-ribosylglycohydrolase
VSAIDTASAVGSLDPVLVDRAVGVVLGAAAGDALGAGYEFAPRVADDVAVVFGVGTLTGSPPGWWTDDFEQTWCVLDAAAAHGELSSDAAADAVAARLADWFAGDPADVGMATAAALGSGARDAAGQRAAAQRYLSRSGRGAGNGSVMRTGPVAVVYASWPSGAALDAELAAAASSLSSLTHADPYAGDGCVLWTFAVDRAMRTGALDGWRDGLRLVPDRRRRFWEPHLSAAMSAATPHGLCPNGFVATALRAALWSVSCAVAAGGGDRWLAAAIEMAVRVGDDTDTVASIAGALAGAACGASALPAALRRELIGWPGVDADGVEAAARAAVAAGARRVAGSGDLVEPASSRGCG